MVQMIPVASVAACDIVVTRRNDMQGIATQVSGIDLLRAGSEVVRKLVEFGADLQRADYSKHGSRWTIIFDAPTQSDSSRRMTFTLGKSANPTSHFVLEAEQDGDDRRGVHYFDDASQLLNQFSSFSEFCTSGTNQKPDKTTNQEKTKQSPYSR